MPDSITLSSGAISVELKYIKPETIYAEKRRVFNKSTLESGRPVFYNASNITRVWNIRQEVPLKSSELTDLETLYNSETITLTESWVDTGSYTVHFTNFKKKSGTGDYKAKAQIELTLTEL